MAEYINFDKNWAKSNKTKINDTKTNEYINKAELIDKVLGEIDVYYDFEVAGLVEDFPAIDIVTCKDCKHIDRTICLTSFPEKYGCKLGNGAHRLDFFCSYGESKE